METLQINDGPSRVSIADNQMTTSICYGEGMARRHKEMNEGKGEKSNEKEFGGAMTLILDQINIYFFRFLLSETFIGNSAFSPRSR